MLVHTTPCTDSVWDGLDCSISVNCCVHPDMLWFLKIDPVRIVGMCVRMCPRPRLLITSGVI